MQSPAGVSFAARALLTICGAAALAVVGAVAVRHPAPVRPAAPGYYVTHVALPERLPSVAPESVGMSAERLAEVGRLVRRGITAGGFPGAAVVIGRRGGEVLADGFGHLDWSTGSAAVSADSTVYDLASLTKVVATTSAIMALYDDGIVRLEDRVSQWAPRFTGGGKERVTIRDLLTHRSGLPPGRDLWRAKTPAEARALVYSTPLVSGCPPGRCYMYSDLGADLLAFVAEAASGERLDAFVARRIFRPLDMGETTFHPSRDQLRRLAPTGAPRGRAHDGNAAALGGVAGHAGLFSTASDLAIFAQMLLDGGEYGGVRIFGKETVRLFTARAAGTRALGWDTCDSASTRNTCGRYLSTRAFGHTGFTGTSLWIDPDRNMFMLLLTNRVNGARAKRPALVIHDVRADVADAAVLAVADAVAVPARTGAFRADAARHWQEPVSKKKAKRKATARHQSARSGSTVKQKVRPKRKLRSKPSVRNRSAAAGVGSGARRGE